MKVDLESSTPFIQENINFFYTKQRKNNDYYFTPKVKTKNKFFLDFKLANILK